MRSFVDSDVPAAFEENRAPSDSSGRGEEREGTYSQVAAGGGKEAAAQVVKTWGGERWPWQSLPMLTLNFSISELNHIQL